MKVRAIRLGYYGNKRRREGEEFVLTKKEHFSEKWMESLEPVAAESKAKEKAQIKESAQPKGKGKPQGKSDIGPKPEETKSSGDSDVI